MNVKQAPFSSSYNQIFQYEMAFRLRNLEMYFIDTGVMKRLNENSVIVGIFHSTTTKLSHLFTSLPMDMHVGHVNSKIVRSVVFRRQMNKDELFLTFLYGNEAV